MPYAVRVAVGYLQELSICTDPWGRFESINAKMYRGQFSFSFPEYWLLRENKHSVAFPAYSWIRCAGSHLIMQEMRMDFSFGNTIKESGVLGVVCPSPHGCGCKLKRDFSPGSISNLKKMLAISNESILQPSASHEDQVIGSLQSPLRSAAPALEMTWPFQSDPDHQICREVRNFKVVIWV